VIEYGLNVDVDNDGGVVWWCGRWPASALGGFRDEFLLVFARFWEGGLFIDDGLCGDDDGPGE